MFVEWEIQKIIDNPNTKILMYFNDDHMKDPRIIQGFMVDETFSTSAQADYGSIAENSIAGMVSGALDATIGHLTQNSPTLNKTYQLAKGLAGTAAAQAGYGTHLMSETLKKWDGSGAPQFTVGLLFIATSPHHMVQKDAVRLMARCYPDIIGDQIYKAPMGYTPAYLNTGSVYENYYQDREKGLCTLKIGKWFQAYGLLLQSADFDFAKETTSCGNPIYAIGKVSFTPYRDISYAEFMDYFPGIEPGKDTFYGSPNYESDDDLPWRLTSR